MDSDSIDLIMDEARDYWIAQTGKTDVEDFDAGDAIARYCNFTQAELDEIANYSKRWALQVLTHKIHEHIAETGQTHGAFGVDPEQLIELVIEAVLPVSMCVTKHRAGNNRLPKNDEYITTVFAEMKVSQMSATGEDLDQIWPSVFIEEVLSRFTPEDAFRVGVLCGQNG